MENVADQPPGQLHLMHNQIFRYERLFLVVAVLLVIVVVVGGWFMVEDDAPCSGSALLYVESFSINSSSSGLFS